VTPDVPTVAEAGVPGYEATIWLGVMAPKGTPADIVDKLNSEINKVIARADVKRIWGEQGAMPMAMAPAEFDNTCVRHRKMGEGRRGLRRQAGVMMSG